MKRATAVAAAAFLALGAGAGAAAADEPLYPPPTEPTIEVTAGTQCVGDAPYFGWEVDLGGEGAPTFEGESVTITFLNPSGADHTIADQPLSGSRLWPGAAVDGDGNGTDWPGVRFEDGRWLDGDEWDWTLPDVDVRFEVGASTVLNLAYPLPSAVCAGPSDPPPSSGEEPDREEDGDELPDLLGLTGSQLGGALAGVVVLLGAGAVLVAIRRRAAR